MSEYLFTVPKTPIDYFVSPDNSESDSTYDEAWTDHPVVEEAYRLSSQLENITIVDYEHFRDLIDSYVHSLNSRALECGLIDQIVTLYADRTRFVSPHMSMDTSDGSIEVVTVSEVMVSDKEGDTDIQEPEDENCELVMREPSGYIGSLKGSFAGFGYTIAKAGRTPYTRHQDPEDGEVSQIDYKAQLHMRLAHSESETVMARVETFSYVPLKDAAIEFMVDTLEEDFEHAEEVFAHYDGTKVQAKLDRLKEIAQPKYRLSAAKLKNIDRTCRGIINQHPTNNHTNLHDAMVDYIKAFVPVTERYELMTHKAMLVGDFSRETPVYGYTPEIQPGTFIRFTTAPDDIVFLPRTRIDEYGVFDIDTSGKKSLYFACRLANGMTGFVPFEHMAYAKSF